MTAADPRLWLARAALASVLAVCAVVPLGRRTAAAPVASAAPEWPTAWEGRPLRPLALGAVEQRFAARFPGHIARFTDDRQVVVMRAVQRPTRQLHPAADCYRGLGYRIRLARLEADAAQRLWRCFVAERDGRATRVCERIVDAGGQAFTDTSSWYWAAQADRSAGPWLAVTVASPL